MGKVPDFATRANLNFFVNNGGGVGIPGCFAFTTGGGVGKDSGIGGEVALGPIIFHGGR